MRSIGVNSVVSNPVSVGYTIYGPSNEMRPQLQPNKAKVRLY